MSTQEAERAARFYERYRYLPLLSFLLLAALAGLALRTHMQRPPADMRRKLASFQTALELVPLHYEDVDTDRLFQAAMQGLIDSLEDPYSRYLAPPRLKGLDVEVEGQFGGVGIQVAPANGYAMIIGLIPGGAAEEKDLTPGDIIIRVNDVDTGGKTFQDLVSTIRGRPGTTVELTVRDPETGEEAAFELERRLLDIAPVELEMLPDRIGMLTLHSFNIRSVQSLGEKLEELQRQNAIDALILDLRGNPGGILEGAVQIADMLLAGGRIATLKGSGNGPREELTATENTLIDPDLPMVVLVDGQSASASELLAGALQSHGRATVIGVNTVGKGAVDSVFALPDGSGLVLKVALYTAGDDLKIDGVGIRPDLVIGELPPPPEEPDTERIHAWINKYQEAGSMQRERAVELLRETLAQE